MSVFNHFDHDMLLEFEKYRKLVEKECGYLEAIKFERFIEVLWLTKTSHGGRKSYEQNPEVPRL